MNLKKLAAQDIETKYLYAIELLLWESTKGSEIKNAYCTYYQSQCKIDSPRQLHIWLYENDYLRNANIEEALSLYTLPDLKEIAAQYGCKKSGSKSDIIDRIILSMPEKDKIFICNNCNMLFPTHKGLEFYERNYDLVKLHLLGGVSFEEYMPYRHTSDFFQNAKALFESKLNAHIRRQEYSGMSICYHALYTLHAEADEPAVALRYLLLKLFLSVNCCDIYSYIFDPTLRKTQGISYMKKRILDTSTILSPHDCKLIHKYGSHYSPSIVDDIYNQRLLSYCLIDKPVFLSLINDIVANDSINRNRYLTIIANNYEKLNKISVPKKTQPNTITVPNRAKPKGLIARLLQRF